MSGDCGSKASPRVNRIFAIGMLVIAAFVLAAAIAGVLGAPLLHDFDFGGIVVGLVCWFFAATYFARARVNAETERFSPESLRIVAIVFLVLGAAVIGLNLYTNLKGA
jgi:hypothetical protein